MTIWQTNVLETTTSRTINHRILTYLNSIRNKIIDRYIKLSSKTRRDQSHRFVTDLKKMAMQHLTRKLS